MSTEQMEREGMKRLAYGEEELQFGELYVPEGAGPWAVMILIHGGFWRAPYGLALMTGLAEDLVKRGLAVWNIEYRRVGDAGGGWPGTLLDVAQAADHVRRLGEMYPLDLQRVVSVGHSAGGHLALWLAARAQLEARDTTPLKLVGVVSLAGAMDLEHVWSLKLGNGAAAELLGGSPKSVPERYEAASPARHLPLGLPQVLIHGTEDDRVPLIVSEAYREKASAAGDSVKLVVLDEADHFVLIDAASAVWERAVKEIWELLGL